jgi:hypothetical protein
MNSLIRSVLMMIGFSTGVHVISMPHKTVQLSCMHNIFVVATLQVRHFATAILNRPSPKYCQFLKPGMDLKKIQISDYRWLR